MLSAIINYMTQYRLPSICSGPSKGELDLDEGEGWRWGVSGPLEGSALLGRDSLLAFHMQTESEAWFQYHYLMLSVSQIWHQISQTGITNSKLTCVSQTDITNSKLTCVSQTGITNSKLIYVSQTGITNSKLTCVSQTGNANSKLTCVSPTNTDY
ncbi:hypothetical protein CDAR_497981 [Caerostris darwini]|uniref:Uncharacterized protein n=1 Tax=Caerostris darwini TaxID=1538125 RepID=A0AAV4UX79_9ARAC|nr:hypothetical protein CDAR_497981 [Caerostris darwini]